MLFRSYLEDFDAWYQSHGDTAMQTYVFDSGTVAPDGTVTLSYTAPYLDIRGEAGELDGAFDVAMTATLCQTASGGWRVISNVRA